jgi:16S rRNA processing protein RimM
VSAKTDKLVTVGRISGVHGIKGWVKVHSYTEPRENIAGFGLWTVSRRGTPSVLEVEDAGGGGGGQVIVKLRGIDDRDVARSWVGAEIAVERAALPEVAPGEYYWTDLEGLEVRNVGGTSLGKVDHLLATGSNDVLVLDGEPARLIPYVTGSVIRSVDLDAKVIVVDWDGE